MDSEELDRSITDLQLALERLRLAVDNSSFRSSAPLPLVLGFLSLIGLVGPL